MPRGRVKQFTDEELKEKRQAREKEYYQQNKEKIKARVQARYYAKLGKKVPPPKPKLIAEERLARKRFKANERAKKYRARDPKALDQRQWKLRKLRSQTNAEVGLKLMLHSAKNRATNTGKEFDIDLPYIKMLWSRQQGLCKLSKVPMSIGIGTKHKVSIDRISSKKGYVKGNCQLVTSSINMAKLDLSQSEFVKLCKAVASNN